jgi:hypothetical protein
MRLWAHSPTTSQTYSEQNSAALVGGIFYL